MRQKFSVLTLLPVLAAGPSAWAEQPDVSLARVRASVQALFPEACGSPREALNCALTFDARGACA